MAKLQMQRLYICALRRDRRAILETLQRLEVVEIRDFNDEDAYLSSVPESEEDILLTDRVKQNVGMIESAVEVLKESANGKIGEPFFLAGRKSKSDEEQKNYLLEKYDKDIELAKLINSHHNNIREKKSQIAHIHATLESLKPWMNLDVPLNFAGTKNTKFICGTLPDSLTKNKIEEIVDNALLNQEVTLDIPYEVQVVSAIDLLTYFTLICLRKDADKMTDVLRSCGFVPPIVDGDKLPSDIEKDLLQKMEDANKSIEESKQIISSKVDNIEDLRFLLDYEILRLDRFAVVPKLVNASKVFVLKGYVPMKYMNKLTNILTSKFPMDIQIQNVDENDTDAPVLLRNNGYSSPLETVIESYSLPSTEDVDPTIAVSLFYYFMFGLMLSDAGYGFIIFMASLLGLVMFKDNLDPGLKKTLKMYLFCGISTIFWGVMFGSYFGDIVDVVSQKFFGTTVSIQPMWFFPVKEPMRLLTFSLIVGIIHLFAGMFLKGVTLAKKGDYKGVFAEVVLWYGLLIGCIILLMSTEMLRNVFKYDFLLPSTLIAFGKYLALLSAIGIILTNGTAENFGVKIAQGLYALYGISGYLSDVLSYSRLLALGLATGVIASVINMMAGMLVDSSGKILGGILFAIVIIGGHIFNLGINALGAYVHTNRLQYVEFFGKFYEGGGEKFNPLKMNTKYFKFKESIKNV